MLAEVVRSGFVEGQHYGHAVVIGSDGSILQSWGDPHAVVFPRSSNKPAQAAAMVRAGLPLTGRHLALAAASHSGEGFHLAAVTDILVGAGLDESALQTPADYPLDADERDEWIRAGRAPEPIAMNCSGKHAAMLATCSVNGWSTHDYREADHPLQRAILDEVEHCAGEKVRVIGIDGCGAPVLGLSLIGLARSASACVQAADGSAQRMVADAMRAWPHYVGGTRRDVTRLMAGVPGLLAKDGAEGVYLVALGDGRAVAIKVLDGADRARIVALAEILLGLGVQAPVLDELRQIPVLGGGRAVGVVRATLAT